MKKIIPYLLFLFLLIFSFMSINDVFIDKANNRYYMLEHWIEDQDQTYEVQVYGSCHAYTSFNPMVLVDTHNINCFNMSNPGEIIPVTYLRMLEYFKKDTPKIAVVEIWGINPYETYDETEEILGSYMPPNIELLPLSMEKLEVINDFDTLDIVNENLAFIKYKERVADLSLTTLDFDYNFYTANLIYNPDHDYWLYKEMINRFEHNGYKATISAPIPDYPKQQSSVEDTEMLEPEENIMKYIDKIIALCEDKDVELIFYRAPYRSSENELRKANYLANYLKERGIAYYDIEKEIKFNYKKDFEDYEHLSEKGAAKATNFLTEKILEQLDN